MRASCPLCALKHLGQARALLLEARKGYPEHYWFALGHLSEAEDELVGEYPAVAGGLRDLRKQLEHDPDFPYPFKATVLTVAAQTGYDMSGFWRKTAMKFSRFLKLWSPVLLVVAGFCQADGLHIDKPMIDATARSTGTNALSIAQAEPLWTAQSNAVRTHTESAHQVTANDGFQGGTGATGTYGGAIGWMANSGAGGAVGSYAETTTGGAIGQSAKAGRGFAGGEGAKAVATSSPGSAGIDAVQLGEGFNTNPLTLQVYGYQLMASNGVIPQARLPTDAAWSPHLLTSSTNVTLSASYNLQALVVTDVTCTINLPAVDTNKTQSIRLDLVAGTNAITFAASISNAASITAPSTTATTPLLFDQPYLQSYWKVLEL